MSWIILCSVLKQVQPRNRSELVATTSKNKEVAQLKANDVRGRKRGGRTARNDKRTRQEPASKWNIRREEFKKRERETGGNKSSASVRPPLGGSNLQSPRYCRSQWHSKIHYWADKVPCWLQKRTEGPLKIVSRCRFHILSSFFYL